MSYAIEARFKEANAHLNAIETALEPHRWILTEAGRDVKRRMDRIEEIDESLDELMRQSQLAARVNEKMARNAEAERTTRSLSLAFKEADAKASDQEASAQPGKPERIATTSSTTGRSQNATKDRKPAKDKSIDDGQGAAAPIMIDGIPIVESTILPSPNGNDTSKVVSGKAAVADQIGSRDSHVEEVEKAPKEFPGISQAAKQASLPARTPADALGGRLSAKSATVPAKSSEDEKIFHNARLEGDWNNVMNKIHSQRITIVCEQTREGMTRYSVPDLSNEEQQSLAVKKFVSRTSRRLEALHGIQRKEVFRLCKWIAENGHRPEKLILDGEEPSLGEANKVIRTLWKHWQNDVDVLAAISAGIEARKTELHLPTPHAVQGSIPVPNREGNDRLSDGGADLVADGECDV